MLWRVSSRPIRSRSKPPGFILPCQPALADRPPAGPGWMHEVKWDGYRVIARKDGEQVRLWARTTSDYSNAFTRIRDAVAALLTDSAVLDGEAILLRSDNMSNFDGLRSRQGQAGAILVAYELMELDGQDMRPAALEERRKRLSKLLSRSNKAMRDGIQLSEALTGVRGKYAYPELKRVVMQTSGKYPNAKILVEDAGSGTSLIQDLQSEGVPVHANRPVGDKVVRMSAQTARIEEGRVLLPESASWLEEFRSEVMAFPNGRHDDQVDSLAQALAWFTKPKRRTLVFG